jgi:hypothetical protein
MLKKEIEEAVEILKEKLARCERELIGSCNRNKELKKRLIDARVKRITHKW